MNANDPNIALLEIVAERLPELRDKLRQLSQLRS